MKVFKIHDNQTNIPKIEHTPPTRKLLGKIQSVKDIESALKLQKNIISAFQRGEIDSAESKSLSYLLQNFVSMYRLNLELEKIYSIINYEATLRVRELELLYREYFRSVVDGLELSEEKIIELNEKYTGRMKFINDQIIHLKSKIKKEINEQTSFNIKVDEPSEKKLTKVLNEINLNLTSKEKYILLEELEKMIG